jgi:endonuclease YncB( thermonuclease family)
MATLPYVYRVVAVEKVSDGDTYWLRLDVGFRQQILIDCRLDGYDCPEITKGSAFEKAEAKRARMYSAAWLASLPAYDDGLWIRTEKDPDSFGRWLGDLWYEGDNGQYHLGRALAGAQLATEWPTRWHEVYDPNRDRTV